MVIHSVTAIAPVNIATIKYWGKRDEKLILPLNDSISVTLSTDYMHTKTTVAISADFEEDEIWLNGRKESINNSRLQNCLTNIRKLAQKENPSNGHDWKVRICSENNFPTAAGLASSAAGYACLVFTLAQVYNVKSEISAVARQGSGSACRSIFGGFVQWKAGVMEDGSDSIAVQVAPADHWPEMYTIILVVSDKQKKVGSTEGMQRSVRTSELLQYRVSKCVEMHLQKMTQAIKNKDFALFAEITMRDSNQFHAVALDTYPPAVYMNDTSHAISSFVDEYNDRTKEYKMAYSFDAGPNACIFVLEKDVANALAAIIKAFPSDTPAEDYIKGIKIDMSCVQYSEIPETSITHEPNLLRYIICTKVGGGPRVIGSENSLLGEDGTPKNVI